MSNAFASLLASVNSESYPTYQLSKLPLGKGLTVVIDSVEIVQDTDFTTHEPIFFPDGSPRMSVKVIGRTYNGKDFSDDKYTFWFRKANRTVFLKAVAARYTDVQSENDLVHRSFTVVKSEEPIPGKRATGYSVVFGTADKVTRK